MAFTRSGVRSPSGPPSFPVVLHGRDRSLEARRDRFHHAALDIDPHHLVVKQSRTVQSVVRVPVHTVQPAAWTELVTDSGVAPRCRRDQSRTAGHRAPHRHTKSRPSSENVIGFHAEARRAHHGRRPVGRTPPNLAEVEIGPAGLGAPQPISSVTLRPRLHERAPTPENRPDCLVIGASAGKDVGSQA